MDTDNDKFPLHTAAREGRGECPSKSVLLLPELIFTSDGRGGSIEGQAIPNQGASAYIQLTGCSDGPEIVTAQG